MSKVIDQIVEMGAMVKVAYEGPVFTVVVAEVGKPLLSSEQLPETNVIKYKLCSAEGVARKSYLDKYNRKVALEIASGRALKALATKVLHNEKIRHRFMG